jgi:predicted nucleic acid-binding protein
MEALPLLVPSASVWNAIETWLRRAVGVGQRFGVGDLLIAGVAAENGAAVWSLDADFRRMAKLGWIRMHKTAGGDR